MKKDLKGIRFNYKKEEQELTIETIERDEEGKVTSVTGSITVNKVYMFSIFIFINQVMRRFFIHKRVRNQITRLENQVKDLKSKLGRKTMTKIKKANEEAEMIKEVEVPF